MLPSSSENHIPINIGGNIQSDMAAFGSDITQRKVAQRSNIQVTQADWQLVRQLLVELKTQVAADAPPQLRNTTLSQVNELASAITAQKPDISRMAKVQQWFAQNMPKLTGAVTSVVIRPIVGKIVEAADEMPAIELLNRFDQN